MNATKKIIIFPEVSTFSDPCHKISEVWAMHAAQAIVVSINDSRDSTSCNGVNKLRVASRMTHVHPVGAARVGQPCHRRQHAGDSGGEVWREPGSAGRIRAAIAAACGAGAGGRPVQCGNRADDHQHEGGG